MPDVAALYEQLSSDMLLHPAVQRGSMMGYPCLRFRGQFFACQDPKSKHLITKLPKSRVAELIASGAGRPFAPAGRVFREWIALDLPDETAWAALLEEARAFAESRPPAD